MKKAKDEPERKIVEEEHYVKRRLDWLTSRRLKRLKNKEIKAHKWRLSSFANKAANLRRNFLINFRSEHTTPTTKDTNYLMKVSCLTTLVFPGVLQDLWEGLLWMLSPMAQGPQVHETGSQVSRIKDTPRETVARILEFEAAKRVFSGEADLYNDILGFISYSVEGKIKILWRLETKIEHKN